MADNRQTAEALTDMPDLGFVPYEIKNRKAYPNAGAKGLTVFETELLDLKAVHEINALFNHITHGRFPITSQT